MKTFVLFSVILAAVTFSRAEDDGQYHPEKYGDDGRYHPSDEGRYTHISDKYNNVNGNLDGRYQPVPQNNSPFQQLLAPLVTYGDRNSNDQDPFASSVAAVTYKPPVSNAFAKARPSVFTAAPKPVVYSSTPKQFIYSSSPKPVAQYNQLPINANKQYTAGGYANIVRQDNDFDANNYHYLYQIDNGIAAEEAGSIDPNVKDGGTKAKGFYEYVGDDGIKYRVDYIADENGFQPTGAHIRVP